MHEKHVNEIKPANKSWNKLILELKLQNDPGMIVEMLIQVQNKFRILRCNNLSMWESADFTILKISA